MKKTDPSKCGHSEAKYIVRGVFEPFLAIFGLFLTIFSHGSQQNIWKSHFFNQLINRAPKNSVFGSNNLVKTMHLLKTNVYYLYHYIYHYIYHYLSNTFSICNLFRNIKPLRPTLCSPSQRLNDGNKANKRQLQKLIIQGNFIFLENIQYFSHLFNGVVSKNYFFSFSSLCATWFNFP